MRTALSPKRKDVERYRALRALAIELNHRIVETIPRQALVEIGEAIGIVHEEVFHFADEDMSSVLMDCCLYDWFENGKNAVQRYSETHPAKPGTDQGYLLNAYLQAKYRVLKAQSKVLGAGFHCEDILNGEKLFLMDITSSHTKGAIPWLATRTIPLGEYWMTGGAALPLIGETALEALARAQRGSEPPHRVALSIVRACLADDDAIA